MGPFTLIDSMSQDQFWAHSRLSAHLREMVGPFNIISGTSQEQCWAHSRALATYLKRNAWPIQDHRQRVPEIMLGPFETTGSISEEE